MTAAQKIALLSPEERKALANTAREGNFTSHHRQPRQMKCFTCGGNHHKADCTKMCLWCKEEGHSLNDCPKRKTKTEKPKAYIVEEHEDKHKIECYQCKGDHHQNDCPVRCVQCWKKGHTANDCPERKAYNETASQYLIREGQTLPSGVDDNDIGFRVIVKNQNGKKGKKGKKTNPEQETKPKVAIASKGGFDDLELVEPNPKPKPTPQIVSAFSTEAKRKGNEEKKLIDEMEAKLKAMEEKMKAMEIEMAKKPQEVATKPQEDSNYTEEDFEIDWDNAKDMKIDFNDEEGYVEQPPRDGSWW